MTVSRPLTDWTDPWEDFPPPVRRAPRSVPARRPRAEPAVAGTPVRAAQAAHAPRPRSSRPSSERARRLHHLRALRRDLLIDVMAAFAAMVVILVATAGLGVVALLEIPLGVAVVASFVVEHRRRRRRR